MIDLPLVVRALGPELDQIARALPHLHDDTYSTIRSVAPVNIELNEFTRPYFNDRCTTHPSLIRASGPTPQTPAAHPQVRPVWERTTMTLTLAHRVIITPTDKLSLVELVGTCHQLHEYWQQAPDSYPTIQTDIRHVARITRGWHTRHTPAHGTILCRNPDKRNRCTGLAASTGQAADLHLCHSCWRSIRNRRDYQRRLQTA